GTWVVDPVSTRFRYALIGKTMTAWFEFHDTVISGGPDYLQVLLPQPFLPSLDVHTGTIECSERGGPWVPATSFVVPGYGLRFRKHDGATWAATDPTHQTSLRGAITIPVTWPNEPQ